MERHLITLLICVCVSLLQVLTLEYTSSWNGAPLGETSPSFILFDKSLKECLYACAMRPWCKVVGYHKYGFCHIFFDTISPEEQQCSKYDCKEQDTSMMFVEREKIISQDIAKCDKACPQDFTGLLKTCDFTSEASNCSTDACPPFNKTDPNGKFLGNTHEIGHKRRLLCNLGYHPLDPNNVTSECRGGRWANVTTCVQGCASGQFQCKNGKCIPQAQVCDSNPDCPPDHEDEHNCPGAPCSEGFIRCADGHCYPSNN